MKRAALAPFGIGAVAAALAICLQLSGVLDVPAAALARALRIRPNDAVGFANFLVVIALSFGASWIILTVEPVLQRFGLVFALLAELLGAAWVLHALGISFPPLPAIIGVVATAALALAWRATRLSGQRRAAVRAFQGHLSEESLDRLTNSSTPLDFTEPRALQATFIFCEIANETELSEDLSPTVCARLTGEFMADASRIFLQAGGYLQGADGEGVRILFGFPNPSSDHATAATRAALTLREDLRARAEELPETLGKIDLRIGISSGTIVASQVGEPPQTDIVIAGEPIEIARRLARANRIYGSQILLDPSAFNEARPNVVARPLDFLRGAAPHDWLEIYELLALAHKATPVEIARRDHFWTALVYYRERRWNEAFAEFHQARGDNGEMDEPLKWYLRRLEPLCLQIGSEPAPVGDPLISL